MGAQVVGWLLEPHRIVRRGVAVVATLTGLAYAGFRLGHIWTRL